MRALFIRLVAEVNGAYWIGEVKACPVRERDVEGFLAKLIKLEGLTILCYSVV